jgi:hypothetical protein
MTLKKNFQTKKITNKQFEEQIKLGKIKHRRDVQNELEAEQEIEEYRKGREIDK